MKKEFLFTVKNKTLVFFFLLLYSSVSSASLWYACANFLSSRIHPERLFWVENAVSLLYFPTHTTVKIEFEGRVYNPALGYAFEGHLNDFLYNPSKQAPLRQIKLRVTSQELARIKKFVETNQHFRIQTCVSGACRAIGSNTGLTFIFPLNQSPVSVYFYLKLLRFLGLDFGRVTEIKKFGGKDKQATFGILAETLTTLAFATSWGLLGYQEIKTQTANPTQTTSQETALMAHSQRLWKNNSLHPFEGVHLPDQMIFFHNSEVFVYSPNQSKLVHLLRFFDHEIESKPYFLKTTEGLFLVLRTQNKTFNLYKYDPDKKTLLVVDNLSGNPFSDEKNLFYLTPQGELRIKKTEASWADTGLIGFTANLYDPEKGWVLEKEGSKEILLRELKIP